MPLIAQQPSRVEIPSSGSAGSTVVASPRLSPELEGRLLGLGTGLLLASRTVRGRTGTIPTAGLDPDGIFLSLDRSTVGRYDRSAARLSDRTFNGAVAFPVLLAFAAGGARRWESTGETGVLLAESLLLTGALTQLGKGIFHRARPYAYLPAERTGRKPGAVSGRSTFHSMPSGHSAGAWAASATAITTHLLRRPEASSWERFGVGFVGGALAGATSDLRVAAGVHFPSDVVAGAGLGTLVGVTIPWIHRGEGRGPSRRAWFEALGGTVAGALVGVTLAAQH